MYTEEERAPGKLHNIWEGLHAAEEIGDEEGIKIHKDLLDSYERMYGYT